MAMRDMSLETDGWGQPLIQLSESITLNCSFTLQSTQRETTDSMPQGGRYLTHNNAKIALIYRQIIVEGPHKQFYETAQGARRLDHTALSIKKQ